MLVGIVHGTSETKSFFYAMLGKSSATKPRPWHPPCGPPKVSTMRDMMDLEANHTWWFGDPLVDLNSISTIIWQFHEILLNTQHDSVSFYIPSSFTGIFHGFYHHPK
jgi:hypothetical protein